MSDTASAQPFERLVELYHKAIYDLILRKIEDAETALDLTQETFVTAYRRYSAWDGKESARTWLCRIAIECCKAHCRRQFRQQHDGRNLLN